MVWALFNHIHSTSTSTMFSTAILQRRTRCISRTSCCHQQQLFSGSSFRCDYLTCFQVNGLSAKFPVNSSQRTKYTGCGDGQNIQIFRFCAGWVQVRRPVPDGVLRLTPPCQDGWKVCTDNSCKTSCKKWAEKKCGDVLFPTQHLDALNTCNQAGAQCSSTQPGTGVACSYNFPFFISCVELCLEDGEGVLLVWLFPMAHACGVGQV